MEFQTVEDVIKFQQESETPYEYYRFGIINSNGQEIAYEILKDCPGRIAPYMGKKIKTIDFYTESADLYIEL